MKESTDKRKARKARDAAKRAACSFADGIEPLLLRKPVHLTSDERKFIGRTWNDADAARTTMTAERRRELDRYQEAAPFLHAAAARMG